jgi:dCTP deaminase
MTVLSRRRILRELRDGKLVVTPIFSREQIGPVSIDLRVGNLALFVRASGLSHVDPSQHKHSGHDSHTLERTRRQKFDRHEFMFGQNLLLHPGALTLVPTLEWVKLPLNLKGVVTARSTWAREGLSIATANFINPGYNGIITLELSNLGGIPMALFPGLRIAQISFYKLDASIELDAKKSQFDLSFEPKMGDITAGDEAFVTSPPSRTENPSKDFTKATHKGLVVYQSPPPRLHSPSSIKKPLRRHRKRLTNR